MPSSISCQVASVAGGSSARDDRGMAAVKRSKRGDKNRKPDPVLERTLERLRRHVLDTGLSQTALAERAGLTQGHVSKLLTGASPEASFHLIARLAMAANVSIDYLVAPAPPLAESAATPASTPRLVSSNPPPPKASRKIGG